jgi:integrase
MYLKCFNNNYSFRYKIPLDVRIHFDNRHELIVTLKTKNGKLAKLKALQLSADIKILVVKIRLMKSMELENIDEMVSIWLQDKLERDFKARLSKSSLEGHNPDQLPRQKQENYSQNLLNNFQREMKHLRLKSVEGIAKDLLEDELDSENTNHKELMFKLLQANVTLFTELNNRNQGKFNFELQGSNLSAVAQRKRMTYEVAIGKYLEYYKYKSTSKKEVKIVTSFMSYTFKTVFGANEFVADCIDDILDELDELALLPTRASEKIRTTAISKEKLFELSGSKIDIVTYNNYLKWSKAFFKWAFHRGHIATNIAEIFKKNEAVNALTQRNPLSDNEITRMLEIAHYENLDLFIMLKVIAYSGMRHSEFFKMRLISDGFDLRDKTLKLKTLSSHRVIPRHRELMDINDSDIFRLQKTYTPEILSKQGMKIIRRVTDDESKVVYSLRHSMATKLLNANVEELKINEILGHLKGNSMSVNRYASGFDISILREAINKVSYSCGEEEEELSSSVFE